ncbi:MAG: leucine-rich repeat domain-containing protein [Phaeodactylibacter sp.]|nr:leucine-rich repeat domain-containing protein [Phaeodactylibacter sp.]
MPLSEKAATNVLRLLSTEDKRNSALAFRLLSSQQATDDFLLSLCGYFMAARGSQRLALRKALQALLLITIKERGSSTQEANSLMWLLNYDPEQKNANPEQFLPYLEDILGLDILALSRYLFFREGQCGALLLRRGNAADKAALLQSRIYNGGYGQTLDLSRLELNQIPDEANQFKEVDALDLSYNRLQSFDVFFLHRFQELRFLDLARNALSRIPDGLPLLHQLQEIDLRKNRVKLPLFEYLRHPLKDILKINLRQEPGFTLDQFDEQDVACILKNYIFDVDGQQAIKLSGMGIRSIPQGFQHYPRLAFIDLQDNPIGYLPSWFLKLPGLREVYCDRGVEYNPSYLQEGAAVFKDQSRSLPRPRKPSPPWLANAIHFSASLPIVISLGGLDEW